MKFFLDTANLDQIQEGVQLGICEGVTTNPTLMARENISGNENLIEHYREISKRVKGEVSVEVMAEDYTSMVREAIDLSSIHSNIIIKIPCTKDGLNAIHTLTERGIRCNCTLIFSLSQAILAVKAGAAFISPFIGRLDDVGIDGVKILKDIVSAMRYYNSDAQVIAASIRNTRHIIGSIQAGTDIITSPLSVILSSLTHPLTDVGLKTFMEDAQKLK